MGSDLSFQLQSFNSLRHFPSFLHFKDDYRNITTQLRSDTWENMEAIKASIFEEFNNTMVPIHLKGISGAATFITEKWVSLVEQTQEVISETDMPDASNLQLLRIMMKRKHMFAEVKRTLDTLCETIAAPELKAPREHLRKVQNKIESWVADLESTLTLSTSYLSLDETKRAITQSTRTTQLTVLAFVFIPLSTVSSGFGMNVDVLSSSPSIYWFVGIGSGVALATFFYAAYYSRINYMLVSTGFYLLSLVLDVSFLILKIIALPFLWLLLILCSPFTLLLQFLLKDLKNACPGYFLLTLDSIWLVFSWCWNASLSALEWSPSILNIRLAWRAGKKTPRMVRLKEDLGLAPEEPDEGCILM